MDIPAKVYITCAGAELKKQGDREALDACTTSPSPPQSLTIPRKVGLLLQTQVPSTHV